jgi:hypothetical protein
VPGKKTARQAAVSERLQNSQLICQKYSTTGGRRERPHHPSVSLSGLLWKPQGHKVLVTRRHPDFVIDLGVGPRFVWVTVSEAKRALHFVGFARSSRNDNYDVMVDFHALIYFNVMVMLFFSSSY